MDVPRVDIVIRSLTTSVARRGVLGAIAGGLLAARLLAGSGADSEAKKKRRRKRKGRKHRKRIDSTEERVDAFCPGPSDNTGLFPFDNDALMAQTFTAFRSGRLVRAELLIFADSTGSADLTLQLRDINASGVPTSKVLGETTVISSDVPSGENTIVFSFADPPSVSADREYALVLSARGPRSVSWKGHRDDSCDGRAFLSEPSGTPFEPQVDDLDVIFTTFVQS